VKLRLDKLQQRGIIRGFDPDLDLRAMGYEVLAFVSLEIAQRRLQDVANHLREIPEVLEIHSVTGLGDLHCRVAARSNYHLQHIIGSILEAQGINRTTTQIALTEQLRHRVLPIIDLVIDHGDRAPPRTPDAAARQPCPPPDNRQNLRDETSRRTLSLMFYEPSWHRDPLRPSQFSLFDRWLGRARSLQAVPCLCHLRSGDG
jgi:DNA-binding Lrp family transcriptional regulator